MRTINIRLYDDGDGFSIDETYLGHAGEQGATKLRIDAAVLAARYPDAVYTVFYRLAGGLEIYNAEPLVRVDNIMDWIPPLSVTAKAGKVDMQLDCCVTDKQSGTVTRAKSYIWTLDVGDGINGAGPAPEAVKTWLKEVDKKIDAALAFGAAVDNVNITATTLAPGETATASGSISTDTGLKIELGLPQGMQGPKGDTGDTGDTGETGAVGAQGIQGIQGVKGDTGAVGPQGPIGAMGLQGVKGDTGERGQTGSKGDVGSSGPQGEKGDGGERGEKGDRGDTGHGIDILGTFPTVEALRANVSTPVQGAMYNVGEAMPYSLYMWDTGTAPGGWVEQGHLQGPKGDTGAQGEKGDRGEIGPQGVKGDTGEIGLQGVKGDRGEIGPQGLKGDRGETGPQGHKGDKGDTGSQGEPGSDAAVPDWVGSTKPTYTAAQVGAEAKRIQVNDVTVAVPAWMDSTTYADYPVSALVSVAGATAGMTPEVVFGVAEAVSGNYAPVAVSVEGAVTVYAKEAPDEAIVIPTVMLWKEVT